jgi:hypothetical protein
MKKELYTLEEVAYSFLRPYFLFLIPFIFQSCFVVENMGLGPKTEIQTSVDMCKQTYSGVSYETKEQSNNGVGFNLGAIILTSPGGTLGQSSGGSQSLNNKDFGSSGNIYASLLSNDPSILANSSQNISLETSGMKVDNSSSGFMSHMFYSGGLVFIQKRSKDAETTITLDYLEVPLFALYQIHSCSHGSLFGGLGPYFAYGVGGKIKSSYGGQDYENKSFDKETGYKPFDTGLGITAGYKMTDSFSFSLAYELGLTNIERGGGADKTKNRGISLNIRYPLDKLIK